MLLDLVVILILDGCEFRMIGEWDGGFRDKYLELGGKFRKGLDRWFRLRLRFFLFFIRSYVILLLFIVYLVFSFFGR